MEKCGTCPNCGSDLVKKEGRNGAFISCSGFPKCKFSMDYKEENIDLDFENIDKCPNCGSELVRKSGSKGSFLSCSNFPSGSKGSFLSCSNFPKCRFSMDCKSEDDSYGNCPECGAPLEKKNGRRGEFLSCSNFPKCRFSKDID